MYKRQAYTVVCKDAQALESMMVFQSRTTKKTYELTDDGVILTEQMAEALGVGEGDTVSITSGENAPVTAVVAHVMENYLMHYVYMTEGCYEKVFQTEPEYNMYWLKLNKEMCIRDRCRGTEFMEWCIFSDLYRILYRYDGNGVCCK